MHVLLTRPVQNGKASHARLLELGHTVLHEPLLAIEALATSVPPGRFDAIVLTSANAAHGLGELDHSLPVYVPGKATARAARQAGFNAIHIHEGSALQMIEAMDGQALSGKNVLYPCAEKTAHDVPQLLASRGIHCLAWPVYRAIERDEFSLEARAALHGGKIEAVLLYSPRTARCFATLFEKIDAKVPPLFALSEAIAGSLPESMAQNCRFPAAPRETDLLTLLNGPKS